MTETTREARLFAAASLLADEVEREMKARGLQLEPRATRSADDHQLVVVTDDYDGQQFEFESVAEAQYFAQGMALLHTKLFPDNDEPGDDDMGRRRPKVESHRLLRFGPDQPRQGVWEGIPRRSAPPSNSAGNSDAAAPGRSDALGNSPNLSKHVRSDTNGNEILTGTGQLNARVHVKNAGTHQHPTQ